MMYQSLGNRRAALSIQTSFKLPGCPANGALIGVTMVVLGVLAFLLSIRRPRTRK